MQCVSFTRIVVHNYVPVSFKTRRGVGEGREGDKSGKQHPCRIAAFRMGRGGRVTRRKNNTHVGFVFVDFLGFSFRDLNDFGQNAGQK